MPTVFFSYAHRDEELREALEGHLALLKRQGVIETWHDRQIGAGQEWEGQIDAHLNAAAIILLLVSPDFMASDYIWDVEVTRAMARHEAREACVIPVILRPVDWRGAPFAKLQALPKDAKPVTEWSNRDTAWVNVATGIRAAAERLRQRGHSTANTPSPAQRVPPSAARGKATVLFLAANPVGTVPLALDEEMREITAKIRAAACRDALELVAHWAVRPDDLLQALNEHRPHVVHFSGHGSEAGELILLNNDRQPQPVSQAALQALFHTLQDNIALVFLNACSSRPQAEAIVEAVGCAIGMNNAIGDQAAIRFAAAFYRALGFGRSVREAFDQGKTALLLEGIPEDNTPALLTRPDVDPTQLFLVRAASPSS